MASDNESLEYNSLFDLGAESASYLTQKKKGDDGLYRPSLDKILKGSKAYTSVIRILPNLQRDGKVGPTALEKHIHYADFKDMPIDGKRMFFGGFAPLLDVK